MDSQATQATTHTEVHIPLNFPPPHAQEAVIHLRRNPRHRRSQYLTIDPPQEAYAKARRYAHAVYGPAQRHRYISVVPSGRLVERFICHMHRIMRTGRRVLNLLPNPEDIYFTLAAIFGLPRVVTTMMGAPVWILNGGWIPEEFHRLFQWGVNLQCKHTLDF